MHYVSGIAIDIPECPAAIAEKMPLSKWTGSAPPRAKDIHHRGNPNTSPRQRWFEENVLRRIAEASGSQQVPWQFATPDGKRWQLDRGCVGHAMANGVLELPDDLEQVLSQVNLVAPMGDTRAAANEVRRLKWLGELARRPAQKRFSEIIRRIYGGECAVTGCKTPAALQAAHIAVLVGRSGDNNDPSNGILLRADIHALFDSYLIALTSDGTGVEMSPSLCDESYAFLSNVRVARPRGARPSSENIGRHRMEFLRRVSKEKEQ